MSKHAVVQALEGAIEDRKTVSTDAVMLSHGLSEATVRLTLSPVMQEGVVQAISVVVSQTAPGPAAA